jgi:alkylated DNA nucleotide flippase Atl1
MSMSDEVYSLAAAIEHTKMWASYGDVAEAIGRPGAARAVANIIARWQDPPISVRIVRSDGTSGGWRSDQKSMPGHAARAQRVADSHAAAGLSREPNLDPWPQSRRLSVTQLRGLLQSSGRDA